ncbi:MAG: 30S ribosomal protein S19e [Acidilobaceae archaeon]|nr:30S ribosomal protein S19e [Acidilobaceae archaeon]MCX8165526.1 30S ribosomal protein S19e [Acidilobaceae archaeon]MDW7973953.1 30S ribosomal protein S19e [Sulfolobales archaeon]
MVNAVQVPAEALIRRVAQKLREYKEIKPPQWALFAKTGSFKEYPPREADWWYVRAASVMRKLYKSGEPVGVGAMRVIYGGRKRRGSAPPHFREGSGSVAREILQQLEAAGLVVKVPGRGRTLSAKGRSMLDVAAKEVMEELVKSMPELSKYM